MSLKLCFSFRAFMIIAASCVVGCGDDDVGPSGKHEKAPPDLVSGDSDYVIRAIVGGDEVRFAPSLSASLEQPNEATGQTKAQDFTTPGDDGLSPSDTGVLAGAYLMAAAAGECGAWNAVEKEHKIVYNPFPKAARVSPYGWADGNWSLFEGKGYSAGGFDSCDDVLFHEEVLLCTASKLEEIASTVGPVRWSNVDSRPPWFPTALKDEFLIPPQRDRDRFIVRDLAMSLLAHVARLDIERPKDLGFASCAAAYADAASTSTASRNLFGVDVDAGQRASYLPPLDPKVPDRSQEVTTELVPTLASARLQHQARILKAAGSLLKRLIVDSVYSDLAGAARAKANAADPKLGNELYWGVEAVGGGKYPYNSMAHAARVLYGRLESGVMLNPPVLQPDPDAAPVPYTDPRCSGYHALELLVGSPALALGPAGGDMWRTRWQDRPYQSASQVSAAKLLRAAGIVVGAQHAHGDHFQEVREAVIDQLYLFASQAAGVDAGDAMALQSFRSGEEGLALDTRLREISDQDWRFAMDRVGDLYAQEAWDGAGAGVAPGFQEATHIAPSLRPFGFVLARGLRSQLVPEVGSRLGGLMAASQCPESASPSSPVGGAESMAVSGFQSTFALAETLRTRLRALAEDATRANVDSTAKFAAFASAELRSWGASGRIHTQRRSSGEQAFLAVGIDEHTLGFNDLSELSRHLFVVYGTPVDAECVAGLRRTCPAEQTVAAVENLEADESAGLSGTGGRVLKFEARLPAAFGGVAQGVPAQDGLIYLVVGRGAPGKVLAAFKPQMDGVWSTEVLSPWRDSLANEVLGLDPAVTAHAQRLHAGILARSPSYCVEGIAANTTAATTGAGQDTEAPGGWAGYLDLAAQPLARSMT